MQNSFEQEQYIKTLEGVRGLLQKHNIPLELWGKGEAKTLEHLAQEVLSGETELVETENGELVRQITAIDLLIKYVNENGRMYQLKETKQVFANGHERVRPEISSIAEKSKLGENPDEVAIRAVKEELGIAEDISPEFVRTENKKKISKSFPGLDTKYVIHFYTVTLNDRQYKSEGYVEKQSDKTTFFEWVEVA